ncbi:MAG: tetratricopeptide repeat protein [Bacteroidota bacterium]|nr:tetratricopeptide repeat protein [Bacteroidota bacterium]
MRIVFKLYLLLFFVQPALSFSSIDSLENLLQTSQGRRRMEILSKLAQANRTEHPSNAISYGEDYLEMAREIGDKHEELKALNILGITNYRLGYYETTLDHFINGLQVSELIADEMGIAKALNNLGILFDEIGDKEKAIDYYNRSLKLKEDSEDKMGIANTLSNIGYIYNELGDSDQAYTYFTKALQIDEDEDYVPGIFASLNNLGLCYFNQSKYDSALYYYNSALSLENQIESLYDKADFLNNLGDVYKSIGKNQVAIQTYDRSLAYSQVIKARSLIKDSFKGLAEAHSLNKNHLLAYECFRNYSIINDSLHNEINSKRIVSIESEYKMKKREQHIQLLVKEAEIRNLILTKNRHISYFLYAALLLFMGLIIVFFQKYQFKARANNLLKVQNTLIEAKNSNITDSINYAKGIQEAILPDMKILEHVFKDQFVICKPRDIVNGVFYWFADKGSYFILAVVDCTGHGVPGAFMNVLGNSLLNQIILDQNILKPSKILNELNKRILSMFHQESFNNTHYDGMDIGIVLYHKESGKIIFSGAKHALYLFKNNTLEIIKGNNISLGGNCQQERYFNEYEACLSSGDSFYLFTDGIIDQFGEKTNKKFMNHRLKKILIEVNQLPMDVQAKFIEDKIYSWKGNQEQTDDMLMIGIKV